MPTQSKDKPTSADINKLVDTPTTGNKALAGFPIVPVSGMDTTVNMLIYGEAGTGKTVLAGSAAAVKAMSPVLFIDVEGGTMPLQSMYPEVEVVRIKTFMDLQRVYDELYKNEHEYKTIVLDSITEMQKMAIHDLLQGNARRDPDINPDVPRIQDWGVILNQTRKMVRGFRDLPINVIFTALNDAERDDKRGKVNNRPLFQGKSKAEVPGFVDIVAFYYVVRKGDSVKRMLLTDATDTTLAKDRSTKLPRSIEDPTMEVIYSTIMDGN